MKAIVKKAAGPGLVVQDVPKPVCGPADVLIKVKNAGVCGTDLHIAEWDAWAQGRVKPPLVLGHEFSGEIVAIGDAVEGSSLEVGQLVTAEGHIICGHCLQCRTGNGHICQKTNIIGVDVVLEMSGVPAAVHQAFALARVGGRVQMLGIPSKPIDVDFATEIIFKGIPIYGVIGRKMYETWNQMQRYLRSGIFDPRPVITHRFKLDQIDDALAAIKSGDAGKVILDIGS
jgi:threonine dehydrogenase-like Zn-dependent dehydrogenase